MSDINRFQSILPTGNAILDKYVFSILEMLGKMEVSKPVNPSEYKKKIADLKLTLNKERIDAVKKKQIDDLLVYASTTTPPPPKPQDTSGGKPDGS